VKHSHTKDDVLVSDGAAAMRRAVLATRGAMTVSKAKVDAMMAKEKAGKGKHK
jgi:hypothetical protein